MEKLIIHPGNRLNIPQEGDYVKLNLQLTDGSGEMLFDSALSDKKFAEIRFKTKESNMFQQLEELIGEMSLFEKTSFELDTYVRYECVTDRVLAILTKFSPSCSIT